MQPKRVERDLQLAVVERPIVRGDHHVNLSWVITEPEARFCERADKRLLSDRENHRVRVLLSQPAHGRDDGVGDVADRCRHAERGELGRVLLRVLGGIVG